MNFKVDLLYTLSITGPVIVVQTSYSSMTVVGERLMSYIKAWHSFCGIRKNCDILISITCSLYLVVSLFQVSCLFQALQDTRHFILRRFVYRNISSIELVLDYKKKIKGIY